MIALTRRYQFPAAHVLCSDALSPAENERIFGKCANPNGHGHNYEVEVTVSGPIDPETGMILNTEAMDELFDTRVRRRYAHRMLNELAVFERLVPTAENIAIVLYDELAPAVSELGAARLVQVRVLETENNSFEYGEAL